MFKQIGFKGRSSYIYRLSRSGYVSLSGGRAVSVAPNLFLTDTTVYPEQWLLIDGNYAGKPPETTVGTRAGGSNTANNILAAPFDVSTNNVRHGALNVAGFDASVRTVGEGEYLDPQER